MKLHMKILSIFAILLLTTSVSAQGPPSDIPVVSIGGDNIQAENDSFVVKIVGGQQVPFYTFWAADNSEDRYQVMFDSIFEASDDNDNGQFDLGEDNRYANSNLALPSMSWDFSDVSEDNEGVHFNMTSGDGMITLVNHLYSSDNSLKFDVVINGYTFQNNDSILVFGFKVLQQGGEDVSTEEENNNRVTFDDAFFEIEETAQDDDGNIDVGLSSGTENGEGKLFMSYEQFSGKLVHDPTIGINGSSLSMFLIGGAIVIVAIAVPIIYKKRTIQQ